MPKTLFVLNAYDFENIIETQKYLEDNVPLDTDLIAILHPSKEYNQLRLACKLGFSDPVVTAQDEVLLYTKFTHNFNHDLYVPEDEIDRISNIIFITLQNFNHSSTSKCSMKLVFDPNSFKLLKNYAYHYKFNSGKKTKNGDFSMEQREISGNFQCDPIAFSDSVTTLLVSVDESTVSKGDKEEADYTLANGSFHTHPIEAYKNNNVGCAWPSKDDYRTVLHIFSEGYGLFHIVSTVEGIYIISFNNQVNRKDTIKHIDTYMNQIQSYFKFSYPPFDITKEEKIEHIKKNLHYINEEAKPHIFHVQFFWWDQLPEVIEIDLKGMNDQCLFMDSQIKFSQLLDEIRNDCSKNNNNMCNKLNF